MLFELVRGTDGWELTLSAGVGELVSVYVRMYVAVRSAFSATVSVVVMTALVVSGNRPASIKLSINASSSYGGELCVDDRVRLVSGGGGELESCSIGILELELLSIAELVSL